MNELTLIGEEAGLSLWLVVKIGLALGLMMYTGFCVMIVRQVELMSRALNGTFHKQLKTVAWGYFIAVIVTLVGVLLL